MHKEILSDNQILLLPLVREFKRDYYLVGGTAVALHIGHRRSIDFDLFTSGPVRPRSILSRISAYGFPVTVTRRMTEQLNVTVHEVKITFFQYPFKPEVSLEFENYARMPGLLDLASMKAYALGRRSKWKDYVDLFFIIKHFYSIEQISSRACLIFDQLFSEKLFRAQLAYFEDIDYSESIDYRVPGVPVEEIKNFLVDKATEIDL
jgi:hypothetical protein